MLPLQSRRQASTPLGGSKTIRRAKVIPLGMENKTVGFEVSQAFLPVGLSQSTRVS